jgi:hypothetical protein
VSTLRAHLNLFSPEDNKKFTLKEVDSQHKSYGEDGYQYELDVSSD